MADTDRMSAGRGRESPPGGRDGLLARLGVPLAAALALAGQTVLSTGRGLYLSLGPGTALLGMALALLGYVLPWRRDNPGAGPGAAAGAGPAPRRLPRGVESGALAILLLGGFYLRLYRIDLIPWGLNNDEAINALEVRDIASGKPFATLTERGLNRETMFHYLAACSYRSSGIQLNLLRAMPAVFGLASKLLDDPLTDAVFPLRSVSIAAGTLTLLLLYVFARDRFGWLVALLATAFLAVSPWHLLYSRVGERAVLAPLFALVTIGLFLRALETGRTRDHVGWGVSLGLGFWTYTSFRAVPIALIAFALLRRPLGWAGEGAAGPRARRATLLAVGVAAVLVAALMLFSGLGPVGFVTRGAYAALITPKANFGLNLLASLGMASYYPARYAVIQTDAFISDGISTTYGLIGLAPETTVVAALSILGLVYAAWRALRRRDAACGLLVLCYLALLLTVGCAGPSLTRMLLNVPWLCLFAALLASRVFEDVAALRRPVTVWAGTVLVGALTAWSCVQGYTNFFLRAGSSDQAMQNFGPTQTIMGMFVRSLPSDQMIYVLHTLRIDTLKYLIGDRPNVHLISDPSILDLDGVIKAPRTTTVVIEFARPFAEAMRYLIMRYPLGDATQVADSRFDPDKVIFYTFTLWKDDNGRAVPPPGSPPGAFPAGRPPGAPSPGEVPPLGELPPLGAPPPARQPGAGRPPGQP